MKAFTVGLIVSFAVAVIVVTFGLASAPPAQSQYLPGYTEQQLNREFQVMKNNVALINEPVTERERWQANVAMWQSLMDHLNDLQNANQRHMADLFRLMRANIYDIGVSDERDRWDDNVQLWRLMLARLEDPTVHSFTQFDYALWDMDANVSRILERGEQERWQSNQNMWQLLVARLSNRPPQKTLNVR